MERLEALRKLNTEGIAPRKAGVMALFYPKEDMQTHLLLILRNTYPGIHSNQVGFPGGKHEESDKDLLHTALRETEEEVGVPATQVTVIRKLSELYIPPSNFEVHPYIGLYHEARPFKVDQTEVAALVEVSLNEFMDESIVRNKIMTTSYASSIAVPAFILNGYTVWGATAMMLSEIKELFKQSL
ncbi:CoA pyrophosphatase [Zeaxanthinibacter enoshimensis]|uniref:NUDIX hydrolase n=1 Tax=Zeaxanthinibacter enoshimensis TaxID=392009 RepID=UPI0035649F7D